MHPYLDHPGPIPFAHRGGAVDYPENSMRAFESAVGLGFRYLETDVHATADGKLVAFHDFSLDRVTDRSGKIRETPWSIVSQALISGTEPIPLFEDLVTSLPDARFNIDVKHESAIAPFVEAVRRTGCIDRICVGSFNDRRLEAVRSALGPGVCTSLGPIGVARLRATSWGAPAQKTVALCAQVPVRQGPLRIIDSRFIAKAHELGLAVHVWTIDDESEMKRLLDLGVDGIMTDRPQLLKDVLLARGLWT